MNDMSFPSRTSTLAAYPEKWDAWLERGWHDVRVADWAGLYMPGKLSADLLFLRELGRITRDMAADGGPDFAGVTRRMQRDTVASLLRSQHLLPWNAKTLNQHFFAETQGDKPLVLSDREHALPIAQLASMVLMAIEAGDEEQARKRLLFAWLIPTVMCSKITHKAMVGRCMDFTRPYSRYAGIAGVELQRIDGARIDPARYTAHDLIADLASIPGLSPIVAQLDGLTFPRECCEDTYTRHRTSKSRKVRKDTAVPLCACAA